MIARDRRLGRAAEVVWASLLAGVGVDRRLRAGDPRRRRAPSSSGARAAPLEAAVYGVVGVARRRGVAAALVFGIVVMIDK